MTKRTWTQDLKAKVSLIRKKHKTFKNIFLISIVYYLSPTEIAEVVKAIFGYENPLIKLTQSMSVLCY